MVLGQFSQDIKDFILGNDGSDKEPDDLKTEIARAIKEGIITKAEASELMTALESLKKLAKKLDDGWIKEIKDAEHAREFDTPEEAMEYEKEKEEKRREEERKRKAREERAANVAKNNKGGKAKKGKETEILDSIKEKELENT